MDLKFPRNIICSLLHLQDRNRLRNEFIGLKLNDVINKEREKCEQKNSGMDASDLRVSINMAITLLP